MEILALETSSSRGSVALWRGGGIAQELDFESDRAHNSALFGPLESILAQVQSLTMIAVGTGPGSYTGVRVGIAAAMGISMARDVPLVGVPSVTALDHSHGVERYAVCGDARRGAWWWAEVEHGRLCDSVITGTEEEIGDRARCSRVPLFTPDAQSPPFCQAVPSFARAGLVASRAAALREDEIRPLAARPVEPLYLRAPFVTVSKKPVFAAPAAAL